MNGILDGSLVGVALLASAGYAVLALGPRGVRGRVLSVLSRVAARAPSFLGLRRSAQRLASAAAAKSAGACGACDDCGSGKAPAADGPAAEVRVPVEKIGRRA